MEKHDQIARNYMYENDAFSKWLGIEILEMRAGYCKAKMTVRPEMLNGMAVAHGGISYSFSDSIFAFASNSMGKKAVSIETSISHLRAIFAGDTLHGESKIIKNGRSTSIFIVSVVNQDGKLVSHFKGTVYKSGEEWE